ncbi:phosphatase PAP2 family protein [Helicobacter macacae]|uniref:Phosphatidic acid phosphatase type 2/haloperoxidase domain-containing protein n=1 Tax=Helicobacter macacae MIT 99-5501 TaxID=1357400 RepID=V8C8H7_9HELI|nr:phosphatase PAP2 family protein [Helicobacter macacae]ETD23036.1 hypothetical protein HMPREF2086_01483 [Helicobacter macacae MIT 99-5501]
MRHAQSSTAKAQKTKNTTKSKKAISLVFVALFVALMCAIYQPSYANLQANQQSQSMQNPHPKSPAQSSLISQESLKTDAQKDFLQKDSLQENFAQAQTQLQKQENEASEAKSDKKDTRFFGYIPREYMSLFSNSAHFFPALTLGYTLIIKDFIGLRQQALGYIAVVGATYAVKYSLYFASPYAKDTLSFAKRPTSESYEAFPSGHTASAFAAVGFVAKRYGAKLGIPAFVLAAAVGESRILLEKHTILQVICGGILGFLLSFFCASPFRRVSTPNILPTYKNKTLYSLLVLVLL